MPLGPIHNDVLCLLRQNATQVVPGLPHSCQIYSVEDYVNVMVGETTGQSADDVAHLQSLAELAELSALARYCGACLCVEHLPLGDADCAMAVARRTL